MLEWTGYAYLVFIVFSIALLFHPLLETNITFICISDIILNFFFQILYEDCKLQLCLVTVCVALIRKKSVSFPAPRSPPSWPKQAFLLLFVTAVPDEGIAALADVWASFHIFILSCSSVYLEFSCIDLLWNLSSYFLRDFQHLVVSL